MTAFSLIYSQRNGCLNNQKPFSTGSTHICDFTLSPIWTSSASGIVLSSLCLTLQEIPSRCTRYRGISTANNDLRSLRGRLSQQRHPERRSAYLSLRDHRLYEPQRYLGTLQARGLKDTRPIATKPTQMGVYHRKSGYAAISAILIDRYTTI
jgi:hypothetical protein